MCRLTSVHWETRFFGLAADPYAVARLDAEPPHVRKNKKETELNLFTRRWNLAFTFSRAVTVCNCDSSPVGGSEAYWEVCGSWWATSWSHRNACLFFVFIFFVVLHRGLLIVCRHIEARSLGNFHITSNWPVGNDRLRLFFFFFMLFCFVIFRSGISFCNRLSCTVERLIRRFFVFNCVFCGIN